VQDNFYAEKRYPYQRGESRVELHYEEDRFTIVRRDNLPERLKKIVPLEFDLYLVQYGVPLCKDPDSDLLKVANLQEYFSQQKASRLERALRTSLHPTLTVRRFYDPRRDAHQLQEFFWVIYFDHMQVQRETVVKYLTEHKNTSGQAPFLKAIEDLSNCKYLAVNPAYDKILKQEVEQEIKQEELEDLIS